MTEPEAPQHVQQIYDPIAEYKAKCVHANMQNSFTVFANGALTLTRVTMKNTAQAEETKLDREEDIRFCLLPLAH